MSKSARLKLAVFLLMFLSAEVVCNRSKAAATMSSFDWALYVLQHEYKLSPDAAFRIADMADEAASDQRVPVDLILAIMAVESDFNPAAHSPCHAIGLMQVRPDVWDGATPFDTHDQAGNVFAGAYILHAYETALGSQDGAIKAYNVGITRYQNGLAVSAGNRYLQRVNAQRSRMKKYPVSQLTTI